MLILFYLFKYLFIFILSITEETPYNLFEKSDVNYLIALASGEAESIVEENLETLFLVVKDFGGLEMGLCHISLSNIGCLVLGH